MTHGTPAYPPFRTVHGAQFPGWTAPPFDELLTIPDLFEFNARHNPDHPAFVYAEPTGGISTVNNRDLYAAICYTAGRVEELLRPLNNGGDDARPVVGILAVLDSISYVTLTVGVLRAGFAVFPISVRNSPLAVAHLLRVTGARAVFVSADAGMRRLAREAAQEMCGEEEGAGFAVLDVPPFEEMYGGSGEAGVRLEKEWKDADVDAAALVLHSSGSTSFPKPLQITHRQFQLWSRAHWYDDTDLCGVRVAAHAVPMFHVMGLMTTTLIISAGAVLAVSPPCAAPVVATPEGLLEAAVATRSEVLLAVPAFLEAWARDPDALPVLQALKYISFGGVQMDKAVGDALVRAGVRIKNAYGMTEIGPVAQGSRLSRAVGAPPEAPCEDWEYIRLLDCVSAHRAYVDGTRGVFELIILDSPIWSPCVTNTEVGGVRAYATGDLMEEHPHDPRLFKVYGRADDQIALSTGEKTNPVPMEALISQDPAVEAAIVFGHGRFQNGVLLQPREPFDPADAGALEVFRDRVWPSVERANKHAPAHSRIFKEMILAAHPAKPFLLTAKSTLRRRATLEAYAAEIDALYASREARAEQVDAAMLAAWDGDDIRASVRTIVETVMRVVRIKDDDDLFQQGCDSLQAAYIRTGLLFALRACSEVSRDDVPANLVYAHPSIAALSEAVLRLLAGAPEDAETPRVPRVEEMRALLEKYSRDFGKPRWEAAGQDTLAGTGGETVLITGSTGRLGSHLLAQMLSREDVRKVYALNRGRRGRERQVEAFETWKLDKRLLEDKERVVFHGAHLDTKDLGVGSVVYEELRSSVTTIIHNAWRVDFNVSLTSFEPLIVGLRNLIDLSLASSLKCGPRLIFISSISTLANYTQPEPAQETLDYGPEIAVGIGYSESKWVAEQVLGHAMAATGLRATIARVGQLCGDTVGGGWSTKEWVPAIARASKVLGCMPNKDDCVTWVPVDVAATVIIDLIHAPAVDPVIHLVAPQPVTWETVSAPMAARLGVQLIPATEWVAQYRGAAEAHGREPAFQLGDFFEAFAEGREMRVATERAVEASESMKEMRLLGVEDVGRWLDFWYEVGFLERL